MTTETKAAAKQPLGFAAAFARQFRLLWTSRRPLLLIVAMLALLVLSGEPWVDGPMTRLLTFWPVWVVLIGPVWAFAVLYNEGPSDRLYHWSLPVGRTRHTLARLAAGLMWLWLALAVLVAVGFLMAASDDSLWQLSAVGVMGWVNLLTGPTIGFLAVSLLTVGSDYPVRWFFGILFLFPLTLSVLDEWLGLREVVETVLEPLVEPSWGFLPVMVMGLGRAVGRVELRLAQLQNPEAQHRVSPELVDMTEWWVATPLWILLLVGLVVLLASRHPDSLPRLRRSS